MGEQFGVDFGLISQYVTVLRSAAYEDSVHTWQAKIICSVSQVRTADKPLMDGRCDLGLLFSDLKQWARVLYCAFAACEWIAHTGLSIDEMNWITCLFSRSQSDTTVESLSAEILKSVGSQAELSFSPGI